VLVGHGGSGTLASAARATLRQLRADVPPRFRTIEDILGGSVRDRRFVLTLVGVFGVVALVLATLGVYGVLSYLVAQRSREISIRVALGAQRRDVTRLIVGQGLTFAVSGIALGLGASLALVRLIRTLLYNVTPTDPVSFGIVIVVVGSAVLAASYIPALRAQQLSPMDVLRGD
jgi:putative ABC transport system permease protein